MTATCDRIDASLAGLRTWAEEGKPLPFIDEAYDFVVGLPMEEAELQAIERSWSGVPLWRPARYTIPTRSVSEGF
jgi:hypothetical protein